MLKLWMPYTQDINNRGLADNIIQPTATTLEIQSDGKLGNCAYGSAVYHSDTAISGNEWTVALWFCHTVDIPTTVNSILVVNNNSNTASVSQYYISIYQANKLRVSVNSSTTFTFNYSFEKDIWYHVAATYDGNTIKAYVNGELIGTKAYTSELVEGLNFAVNCRTGNANGTSLGYGTGKLLNDVRAYDNVLSAKEIKLLARGLVCHYPLNREGLGQDNLLVNSRKGAGTWTTSYNANQYNLSESLVESETYTVSAKINTTPEKKNVMFYFSGGSYRISNIPSSPTGYYSATFTATATYAGVTSGLGHGYVRVYISNTGDNQGSVEQTGSSEIEWIKLEKGSVATPWVPNSADSNYTSFDIDSNIEYDTSGNGYSLTKFNNPGYSSDTARYMVSTVFDGTNYIGGDMLPLSVKSASIWFKTTSTATQSVFADYNTKLGCYLYNGVALLVHTTLDNGPRKLYGSNFKENDWNHVVIVKNDDRSKDTYLNGVLLANGSNGTFSHNSETFYIARSSVSGNRFVGNISDFRAYATQLTQDDVLELYHTGAVLTDTGTLITNEFVEN